MEMDNDDDNDDDGRFLLVVAAHKFPSPNRSHAPVRTAPLQGLALDSRWHVTMLIAGLDCWITIFMFYLQLPPSVHLAASRSVTGVVLQGQ